MPHVNFGTKDTQGFEFDVCRYEVCSALLRTPDQTLTPPHPPKTVHGKSTASLAVFSRRMLPQTRRMVTQSRRIPSQPRRAIPQSRRMLTEPRRTLLQKRRMVYQSRRSVPQPCRMVPQPRRALSQACGIDPQTRWVFTDPSGIGFDGSREVFCRVDVILDWKHKSPCILMLRPECCRGILDGSVLPCALIVGWNCGFPNVNKSTILKKVHSQRWRRRISLGMIPPHISILTVVTCSSSSPVPAGSLPLFLTLEFFYASHR